MQGKLRRLGVADANIDGMELNEGSTAVSPYLFLARHGMAVAGTGAGPSRERKPVPVTTADTNGANAGNTTGAVPDSDDNKRTIRLVQ